MKWFTHCPNPGTSFSQNRERCCSSDGVATESCQIYRSELFQPAGSLWGSLYNLHTGRNLVHTLYLRYAIMHFAFCIEKQRCCTIKSQMYTTFSFSRRSLARVADEGTHLCVVLTLIFKNEMLQKWSHLKCIYVESLTSISVKLQMKRLQYFWYIPPKYRSAGYLTSAANWWSDLKFISFDT